MHLTAEASCFDFSALCRTFMATIKIPSSDDHCFISKLWSHLRSEEAGVPLDLNDPADFGILHVQVLDLGPICKIVIVGLRSELFKAAASHKVDVPIAISMDSANI